jgi:uncharacterized protein
VPGETDLRALLAGMTPMLRPEEYVFRTLPPGGELPNGVVPFATVREDEGLTVVIERRHADALGSPLTAPFRAVTLAVCSSLHAVGFIAVVARALADAGIAANVISGFHHDYVFVPADFAEEALHVLRALAARG